MYRSVYQKIQVVVHVVEQTTDHGRQVNYVGGFVFFEQIFRRLQIAENVF